jgi:hypothetical protein
MPAIRIVGLVNGEPSEYDGTYVVDYDPTPQIDEVGGFVHLVVTEDVTQARQFRTYAQAVAFYQSPSRLGPRPDGEPDRPLSAFTVEIVGESS